MSCPGLVSLREMDRACCCCQRWPAAGAGLIKLLCMSALCFVKNNNLQNRTRRTNVHKKEPKLKWRQLVGEHLATCHPKPRLQRGEPFRAMAAAHGSPEAGRPAHVLIFQMERKQNQKRLSNGLLSGDDSWGIELSASPSVQCGWVSAEVGPLLNVSLKSLVASDPGHAGKLWAIAPWDASWSPALAVLWGPAYPPSLIAHWACLRSSHVILYTRHLDGGQFCLFTQKQ